ncbi:branched-chain amino acid ABC transporter permease [Lactobacillus sp. ZJLC3-7]|uniref:Branched-chain amino acid ABC transporter permease n=2 Tax=Levilactobacillus tujiorum TaxID=2912243 RepID=A0ABX1LAN9_9LACO|nr:branched-chain amino acid ABC transporter permease [Lactobacillus sp. HBUAS51387]NLR30155.1 branched-chain amino acid ABC transporter permease [Levilactobacillus tujiorum]NLR31543.1 branched-chain amino acid ABC transporter permease [Levilactobacillus tujiorum]
MNKRRPNPKQVPDPNEPLWRSTLRVAMPLNLSYIPIGLACGILLHAAGFNTLLTGLVSLLIFSGGAQFLIATMLTINSPLLSIVLMLFFLELRYALLSSSLSPYLKGSSNRFLFMFAVSLNDENYAINYLKFATDKKWTGKEALMVEHYSLLFWAASNVVGSLIGSALKIDLSIVNFALTALFLYMIVMQIKNRLTIVICLISGVLAAVCMMLTKSTLGLVISTIIASLIGFALEATLRKKLPDSHWLWRLRSPGSKKEAVEHSDAN